MDIYSKSFILQNIRASCSSSKHKPHNKKGSPHMKKSLNIDYNEEFEEQLMTEEEKDKVRAKKFINLLSEMFLKYESEIEKQLINNQGGN